MRADQIITFVAFVGVLVQLVGALLLVGLFALLRRFVLRRSYFRAWANAWTAVAVALGAVVLRALLVAPERLAELPWLARLHAPLAGVYLFAKLMMLAWLVAGTFMYVGRRVDGAMRWVALAAASVAVAATPAIAPSLRIAVLLQAPLLALGLGTSALLLLRLPASRRTLGTRAAAGGFALIALLWCVYPFAFTGARGPLLAWVASYSAYLDLVCQMILGYAMVVVLMEDAKREVDDAQAELRIAHDQLRRDTLSDPLTGALNRRAFTEGVGLDLARASFGTVALLDLDNLKVVNDAHGHGAGDALLRHLVESLRHGLRALDKVYRWGGDEFLLVVPGARADEVRRRVTEIVDAAEPLTLGDRQSRVPLEVSLGAVDFASGEQLDGAIADADARMYREKQERKLSRPTPAASVASVA